MTNYHPNYAMWENRVLFLKSEERKSFELALSLLLHVMLKVSVRVKRKRTEKKGISIVNEGVQKAVKP